MYTNLSTGVTDPDKLSKKYFFTRHFKFEPTSDNIFEPHQYYTYVYYANNIIYMYYILRKQSPRSVPCTGTQST